MARRSSRRTVLRRRVLRPHVAPGSAVRAGRPPHARPADDVATSLRTDLRAGLPQDEVERRRAEYGPNELIEAAGRSPWQILYEQFATPMVLLLLAAAAVSVALGKYADAAVILLIVVLNATLGYVQDRRAERSMAALKQMASPLVAVRRGGESRTVRSTDLVPGDVVTLEAGGRVPADGRLVATHQLRIDEAALTGESGAVTKAADGLLPPDAPLADRVNCAFAGTVVTAGRGQLLVTATGMRNELGRIAGMLQTLESEDPPLQRRLGELGKTLAVAVLVVIAAVVALELLRRRDVSWPALKELAETALSMAVAAVPEGLPAVATIGLATGARRMLRRNALIRRLPAIEALGSVTLICSDKTGTLTQNRMTVTQLEVDGERVELPGDAPADDAGRPPFALLLAAAALCNDAEPAVGPDGEPAAVGEPTEAALAVAAARAGLGKEELERRFPRVAKFPFDSDRKRMTTVHRVARGVDGAAALPLFGGLVGEDWEGVACVKGTVGSVLSVCDHVWTSGAVRPLDGAAEERVEAANAAMVAEGVRVLAVGFRRFDVPSASVDPASAETGLTFLGLLGLSDPARPEAAAAIAECRTAGVRVKMITGDHPLTAAVIARDLGLASDGRVVTGRELDDLLREDGDAFAGVARAVDVFARVTPEHKLKLVEALRTAGPAGPAEVVAMTGDGVNDAPALKRADIGVAMGLGGTDVAREASAMVLTDDNFATIVAAVKEGRTVYGNIRKFLRYALPSNVSELWVMTLGPLLGLFAFAADWLAPFGRTPLPLLPLQILWINLVTDGLPGLAFAAEPPEKDVMRRPPVDPRAGLLGGRLLQHIVWAGPTIGLLSFFVGWAYWDGTSGEGSQNVDLFRTVVFTVLTFSQMCHALAVRSDTESLFSQGLTTNCLMVGAVGLTVALHLAILYVPALADLFHVVPLTAGDLLLCVLAGTVIFWAVELQKWILRSR
ncbi:cation-translocating P-type ATPase [Alienimonas sp. DA493]|uniref:cation-translocating P-type ATPase n=1 Tax=Alienimonas sp. DA493 TaxID=3373605 RepID=UPI003754997C